MRTSDINIRDPYVLLHDNKYYLYGTRRMINIRSGHVSGSWLCETGRPFWKLLVCEKMPKKSGICLKK